MIQRYVSRYQGRTWVKYGIISAKMELWAVLAEACVPEPSALDMGRVLVEVEETESDFLTYAQEAAERGRVLEVMAAYRVASPGTFDEATLPEVFNRGL